MQSNLLLQDQDHCLARPQINGTDSDSDSDSSCSSDGDGPYKPLPFLVERVHLDISFNPGSTHVTNTMHISPAPSVQQGSTAASSKQLVLDGKKLQLLEICLDGAQSLRPLHDSTQHRTSLNASAAAI
jgi:aminopeptidase N